MSSDASTAYEPSDALVSLVKTFEGFAAEPYKCPAGLDTLGYGHVMRPGEVFEVPITEAEAEALLREDLRKFAAGVRKLIARDLRWYQFDALVSFAFNVGIGAFSTSTLRRKVNEGKHDEVRREFAKWRFATVAGKKTLLPGLVRRRQAEADLYGGVGVPAEAL